MTTIELTGNHQHTHLSRLISRRLLVAGLVLGAVLAASAALASYDARAGARPGVGRVLASGAPIHGKVQPGKVLASQSPFAPGGVKSGKVLASTTAQ